MQKHVKIYIEHFDYPSWIGCEVCDREAVDIHHIEQKGMGGSKTKDYIENLMALCRECHQKAHANEFSKLILKQIHNEKITRDSTKP